MKKKEDIGMAKTTLRLPSDLLKAAKVWTVKNDTSLQDLVERLLREHLERKGGQR
jgi:hypothetical protein